MKKIMTTTQKTTIKNNLNCFTSKRGCGEVTRFIGNPRFEVAFFHYHPMIVVFFCFIFKSI